MENPLYDRLFGAHAGRGSVFATLPDGATVTHADFLARATAFAGAMGAAGLEPGDRLCLQVEKSVDALAVYAACARSGVILVPLNPGYTAAEVGYFLNDSGAKLFICDPAREAELAPGAAACGARIETLDARKGGSLARAALGQPGTFATVARGSDDLAAFLYTSGTTGRAKGAMLTQENLLSNAAALREAWRFTDRDVLLHALPIFHTHGLFVATNVMLLCGGAMLVLPRFEADEVLRLLPRATAMMGVPTFYTRLLDDPRLDREATAHMRLFVSGSAPLLPETHRQFQERTGHAILERYGMTETGMNASNPYEGERRPGTVGFALPGVELKVTDPATGATLPAGEIGQVEVRGPNVFRGYWQMPEKTREELRPDGFFQTGDLGRFDAEGYLHIVGRSKDLVISGGFNVYPKEIELILDEQPGVLESAVFGVPHPDFGEAVMAVIVPLPGAAPDLGAIRAALAAGLARFKQPKALILADDLPRNAMGKVQKAALRERHREAFAATASPTDSG
jgi:malonyl-CoA/methylmalonyl-CoA synthetase